MPIAATKTFACFTVGVGVGLGGYFLKYKHWQYRQREMVFATVKEEIQLMGKANRKAMKRKYAQAAV
jgi:membrane-bound ClpP family serine protease